MRISSVAMFLCAATAATAACSGESASTTDTTAVVDTAPAPAPTRTGSGFLDPNTVTAAELAAIPGMSDSVALAFIAGRPYSTMVAVDRVLAPRLAEQWRDSVYTRVWKPIDLNTASSEEILLIPGVGPRMRHEFEEYRPYEDIEEFRREIGKYVDDAEVTRLERYVIVP